MRYNLQSKPVWALAAGDLLLIVTVLAFFAYFQVFRPTPYETVSKSDTPGTAATHGGDVSESDGPNAYFAVDDSLFSDTVISTDSSYTSPDVSVTLTEGVCTDSKGKKSVYHLEDIYVRDVRSIRSVLARDTYGYGITEGTLNMAKRTGAVCAINGDYYGMFKKSMIIRNGVLYGEIPKSKDICVLYENGEMVIGSSERFVADTALANGAWQAWSFGPSLLDENGSALTEFKDSAAINGRNPRSVIGFFEPGHYCFLAVDGRSGSSAGLTMDRLAQLCSDLGMACAYNLDGGQTSVMTFGERCANNAYHNGRAGSDIICVIDPETEAAGGGAQGGDS